MKYKSVIGSKAWNAELYDKEHSFVSNYGMELIHLLSPKTGEKILDVGCGTGDLAYQISQAGAEVVGIDSAASMIQQARLKYPALKFEVADARKMQFINRFDAVFSNAALHWMQPPDAVLNSIWLALKPGGRFIAEFGGKNNVGTITMAITSAARELNCLLSMQDSPWYLPSIGEYTALMEENGFTVSYAFYFDRPTKLNGVDGLKSWIAMFCSNWLSDIPEDVRDLIIEKAEATLKPLLLHEGRWVADYKRLRVVGVKQ